MICKKCGKEFPSSEIIDGKRRVYNKRKYCLECSPFGKHNTRLLIDKKLFCIVCDTELTGNQRKYCSFECKTKWLGKYSNRTEATIKSLKKTSVNWTKRKKTEAREKMYDECFFCGKNDKRLIYHRKDGVPHKTQAFRLICKEEYPQENWAVTCYRCHKGVHWCMDVLRMDWGEILDLQIKNLVKKHFP